MKKKIDESHIKYFNNKVLGIKKTIPFLSISPRIMNDNNSKGFIFVSGLNGTKSTISYFNFPIFEDKWLFTFDNRAQRENKNFPSKKYRKYVNDAKLIIDYLIETNPNIKQWYLIGESWGGAIISLLTKKQLNSKINSVFMWNIPCKIIKNVDPRSKKESIINNLKTIINYVFSIPLKTNNPVNEKLTNNKILLKTMKIYSYDKINIGTTIAAWRTFKPAWNNLIKNHNNINFRYIQSNEDILKDDKMVQELKKRTNKVIEFKKGTHILSFDNQMDDFLFDELSKFINE